MAIISFIISLLSGVIGITLGVIFAYIIANRGRRFEAALSGFTGGLMLSIIYIDVLPEAFNHAGLWLSLLGIFIGVIILLWIEGIIDKKLTKNHTKQLKNSYLKTAMLISIALAFHNIPEGIAIGSLLSYSLHKGLKFGMIITIHNIPEGMMIAIPMKKSDISIIKNIFISFAISLFMGIGGFIGCILSSVSNVFMAISLGVAAGIMLYITCSEILIKCSNKWKGRSVIISLIIGTLIGIIISY